MKADAIDSIKSKHWAGTVKSKKTAKLVRNMETLNDLKTMIAYFDECGQRAYDKGSMADQTSRGIRELKCSRWAVFASDKSFLLRLFLMGEFV